VLKNLLTAHSLFSISRLEEIARNTQFVIRNSQKFSPAVFLLTLLKSVSSGKASFNQLAVVFKEQSVFSISKQAIHKRINKHAIAFLLQVIQDLLSDYSADVLEEFEGSAINRILVEDSSTLRMPKTNAELFPAHGNASGSTAGVKCDLCYDLLSQKPIGFELYQATEQDRVIGKETLTLARKGDLVLRDMGYFDLAEFAYLEGIGACWLTRMPLTTNLVVRNKSGGEISLEKILTDSTGSKIDLEVFVGDVGHRCRLVAVRADQQTTEKRKRERRSKARQKGKTASQAAFIRDGWHVMLTNLPKEQISVSSLAKLYRSRWAIEIQFRAWKQSTCLGAALNRKSNKWHLEALVLSAMIIALMGLKLMAFYARKVGLSKLSPEKLMDWLTQDIMNKQAIENLVGVPPDLRHIQRDMRKRKSPITQGLKALS